jgi:uncharacterized protein YndB with AHSA1/START domain
MTNTTHQPDTHRSAQRPMTTVERHIDATPDAVFGVLADGWLLPVWVVGATHIRDVDAGWPAASTRVHHQVGAWPLMISDTTGVVESERPHRLVLQARAWPFGEARIEITIEADGAGSLVRMAEGPTHGTAFLVDNPLQRRLLAARNRESLTRLGAIAEHRRQ